MPRLASALIMIAVSITAACSTPAPETASAGTPDRSVTAHPAVTDPRGYDPDYPPAMLEISFESAGSKLNAILYVADGPGPHPTVIFLHGYPGNERNLDLAQAVRRSGANAMYFNYRGSWGSGGEYSIENSIEDVARAVAVVREDAEGRLRADPSRVVLVGHSLGGFLAAYAASEDPSVACVGLLAPANLGMLGRLAGADAAVHGSLTDALAGDFDREGGPLNGEVDALMEEIVAGAEEYDLVGRAGRLSDRDVLLVIGERDAVLPKAEHHDPFLTALRAAAGTDVEEVVYDDDHSFSVSRIALATRLVDWLWAECWG